MLTVSIPKKSLHKKVFQNGKMSKINERPSKGKGGRISAHSESFKVQVALEYLDGRYSYLQVGKKYELPSTIIRSFVIWYKKNRAQIMPEDPIDTEPMSLSPREAKELEKRLAFAEMKIAALEKVIAIANEAYGTDLKKKAATK